MRALESRQSAGKEGVREEREKERTREGTGCDQIQTAQRSNQLLRLRHDEKRSVALKMCVATSVASVRSLDERRLNL
jgi:hypothetical protein